MNARISFPRQAGFTLVLALLLLFVLTVLGVASFSNTTIQERSAGNARSQAMAFEAAAAGASNAINFFDANRDLGPDQLCGDLDHEGWVDPTAWVGQGQVGGASLRQRMYCLADAYPCTVDDVDCDVRPPRSQLFVLSRGEVLSDGVAVATRDIEVRLDIGADYTAGDGCGAICFPGCESGTLDFPTSNAFQVDGAGGPAITAGCEAMADAVRDGIRDNRIGNYVGGIATTEPGMPWSDPDSVEAFRQYIEMQAHAAQEAGTCMTLCYAAGNWTDMGNSMYGTVALPQITYFDGNVAMGGNISGAGILMVNGNLAWNGTPNFQGLIVVLGGTYELIGGGTGGDHAGSIVVLDAPGGDPAADFEDADFLTTGGGTAEFNFDCTALWAAHDLLGEIGQTMWSPECDVGPQNPYQAGPTELIIASWRENIGWREDFFGSD